VCIVYGMQKIIICFAKLSTETKISIETLVTIRYVSNYVSSVHPSCDEGKGATILQAFLQGHSLSDVLKKIFIELARK